MDANKKHILILASWFPNRYTPFNGDFVQRIAEQTALNNKVTVLHICNKSETGKSEQIITKKQHDLEERIYYLEKVPLPLRFPFFLFTGSMLFEQIEKERGKVDCCHVQVVWKMGLLAYRFKRKYQTPYFVTEHWTGYLPQHYQLKKFGLKYLSKLVLRNASQVFTVSKNLGIRILQLGMTKSQPIVMHNIVRWSDPVINTNPDKLFTFVHLSNFRDEQKNVSGIINAFANALKRNNKIKLLLGGSNQTGEFEKLVRALQIPLKHLQFLPEMSHEYALSTIAQSDALICFSNFETFGITCAEAICMGVPVIYTPCGGPEEYIEDNMGIQVPINNQEALTNAIIAISRGEIVFDRESIKKKAQLRFDSVLWSNEMQKFYSSI
ncbi:MAG: glycosyltransferase [Bacteroidia bacterium]|nr:glycosyltransferase [Bacteroidia bacterium]